MQIPQNWEYIDSGSDAAIYKIKNENSVAKIYRFLRERKNCTAEELLPRIEKYARETLAVKEFFDIATQIYPNLKDTIITPRQLKLKTIILPQGTIKIIDDEVILIGQEYALGPTLDDIMTFTRGFVPNTKREENLKETILQNKDLINQYIQALFYSTLDHTHVGIILHKRNIKPQIDYSTNNLNLIITDLVANLRYHNI